MKLPFHGGNCSRPKYRLAPNRLVRFGRELEGVRQHDQVERVLGKWQPMRVSPQLRGRIVVDAPSRGDPALRQQSVLGQPDLDGVVAEYVGHRAVEPRLLAGQQIAAERRGEPVGERA
jgi:hypothetical protein